MPSLKIVKGPGEGTEVALGERVTLGRSGECDIQIKDVESSRVHAQVAPHEGRYHIKDLDSSNGTLVNGSPISEHVLRHGDRIQVGEVIVEFVDDETRLAVARSPQAVEQEPKDTRGNIGPAQPPATDRVPVNARAPAQRGVSANTVIIVILAALLLAAIFLLARLGGIWFIRQAPTPSMLPCPGQERLVRYRGPTVVGSAPRTSIPEDRSSAAVTPMPEQV